jgi:hypothetical protein
MYPFWTKVVGLAIMAKLSEYETRIALITFVESLDVSLFDLQCIQLIRLIELVVQVKARGVVDHFGCTAVHCTESF